MRSSKPCITCQWKRRRLFHCSLMKSISFPTLLFEAKWKIITLDKLKVKVRAYNDQIPGPLIETKAGRTLKIRVKNLLTPYNSKAWGGDMNVPHMLDHTNLHLHGLDVAPHIFEPLGT